MYFAAPLLTLVALGTGSLAATVLRRDPATHVGTFQTYAHQGCSFMPLCTRVVYGADVVRPPCHSFGDDSVESVKLTEIGDGCQCKVQNLRRRVPPFSHSQLVWLTRRGQFSYTQTRRAVLAARRLSPRRAPTRRASGRAGGWSVFLGITRMKWHGLLFGLMYL